MSPSRSRTPARDLTDAESAWGSAAARPLASARDLPRLATRLSLALHLAGAAARDPATFRTVALAIRRHRALQKPLELYQYLRFVRPRRVDRYLEIGTLWGGTFFAHCAVMSPTGHAIAIDAFPRESIDTMTTRFQSLARPSQRVTCIWADSHAAHTTAAVNAALGGEPLDLLFLDGDHSPEGAARDYDLYAPLVRRGGLIAFHDITASRADGVPALWRSLRDRYDSVEFVDRRHAPHGLGIGVLIVA